ncbi:hypothetical protein O3M35_001474 [Rhynocoris fuscipes]|uniref:Fatty acyl-CoA reductase n=1 Tax=Rhynocoris fuscipes TaxID=488301 RepID=A0AAW1CNT5_9HEMI
MDDVLQDPLFSVLSEENPKFRQKITPISGDCGLPGLGLTLEDRKKIIDEVSVIFHGAATLKFDEKLKIAYNINVRGTKHLLELAKETTNLKVFVHISTAYTNCHLDKIEEKIYDPPMDDARLEEIVENMDEELITAILPKILGKLPNTYAFTKAIAEVVASKYSKSLPMVIFRPGIVVGTYQEPIIGWTDNPYGPTGIVVGAGCGIVHTLHADIECIANLVPVDMTVAALITSAAEKIESQKRGSTLYNYVSSGDKPLKWREFKRLIEKHGDAVPPIRAVWCYFMMIHKFWLAHFICVIFLHYLPAMIFDTIGYLTRSKNPSLYQIYKRIDKHLGIFSYFAFRSWEFTNDSVRSLWTRLSPEDKKQFNFDISSLDWDKFFYNYIRGLRY